MNRLGLVIAVAVVVLGVAAAAGATSGLPARAPVTAIDAAGGTTAAGLAWTPTACEGAVIWSAGEYSSWRFHVPRPCPATSTGRGVAAVSNTGFRVAFLSYVGGNTREWRLWTATREVRAPHLVRSASADAGEPSPIRLGNGGDGGIPYAVGRTVVLLNDNGTRNLTWTAPGPIAALNATYVDLAVTLADGDVVVVVPGSRATRTYAGLGARNAQAVENGVVYETPTQIVLRRGNATRVLRAIAGARLITYESGRMLYRLGRDVHLYVQRTGKDIVRRHLRKPYLVDADRQVMAWASGARLCSSVYWWDPGSHLGERTGC